jgi:hypothetical protein
MGNTGGRFFTGVEINKNFYNVRGGGDNLQESEFSELPSDWLGAGWRPSVGQQIGCYVRPSSRFAHPPKTTITLHFRLSEVQVWRLRYEVRAVRALDFGTAPG